MRLSIEKANQQTRTDLEDKRQRAVYKKDGTLKELIVYCQCDDLLHGIHVVTREPKNLVDILYNDTIVELSQEFPELVLVK
jgi:hypothetical protein